ncbi:MAG: ABC transporter ATP-binding protein [Gemmatimonadales bacterium]
MSAEPPSRRAAEPPSPEPLLVVTGLVKHYLGRGLRGRRRPVHALNGVSFTVARGETLGVVGESGSGKSTLGRAIVRLVDADGGSVRLEGTEVLALPRGPLRALRRRMQMVFQDPYGSLNPRMAVGAAVREGLEIHRIGTRGQREERVRKLFREVGLDPAQIDRYPHQLSGGQRQRVGIARALAVDPAFLVCDEPVSALDVSVQAQVLNLLISLQRHRGLTYLFIAHDLAVVRQLAHRIAVMYYGRIVELAGTDAIIHNPRHPYTRALLSAVPTPEPGAHPRRIILSGEAPKPTVPPPGCPFFSRCFHPRKDARCTAELPPLRPVGDSLVACHYAEHSSELPVGG